MFGDLQRGGMRVKDRERQADSAHHRYVRPVVANARTARGFDPEALTQLLEHRQLLGNALIDVADPEVACTLLHMRRVAARNDRDLHANVEQSADAVTILHVEYLERLAFGAVIQAAIREHTIHIEDEQLDRRRGRRGRQSISWNVGCCSRGSFRQRPPGKGHEC